MALDHIDEKVVTAAVMTYLSYGTYLNDRGEYARAIPVLRQGIELSERSNNAVHRYKLYQRISEAETALGRYREALAAAGKSSCKANAAVARELACWVWEIGRRAEGTLG